jgi:Mrp family chromosome partitioning ATPase
MTRIFDALKKAEAALPVPAPAPAPGPVPPPGAPASRGTVTRMPLPEGARGALPLLGALEVGDEIVREMTTLRVGIESVLRDRQPRIVMFVSPQGGEGTSTVALQFAQVLARDPAMRPLVVDAHVRRPAYHIDAVARCAVLDARLLGRAPQQGAVVTANLAVVPNADDLRRAGIFQPATLRQVLDANVGGFDWVVVDGPPVIESPDGASLAALADGVVIVVQAGRTKRPVLTRAADLLQKAGARTLGSVLNRRVHEIPEFIYRRI